MTGEIQSVSKLNKSIDGSIADKDSTNIKVITLNCWGLYGVSKLRRLRMNAIGKYLAESDFDIVLLEEVWTHEDFELLQMLCSNVYPFSQKRLSMISLRKIPKGNRLFLLGLKNPWQVQRH